MRNRTLLKRTIYTVEDGYSAGCKWWHTIQLSFNAQTLLIYGNSNSKYLYTILEHEK